MVVVYEVDTYGTKFANFIPIFEYKSTDGHHHSAVRDGYFTDDDNQQTPPSISKHQYDDDYETFTDFDRDRHLIHCCVNGGVSVQKRPIASAVWQMMDTTDDSTTRRRDGGARALLRAATMRVSWLRKGGRVDTTRILLPIHTIHT
jgi:hypothetical protein